MKKAIKIFASILLAAVAVVFVNGVYYVFYWQSKSAERLARGEDLNLYECCSIYTMHCAAVALGWMLSPEASYQCAVMMFSKEGSVHHRSSDFMRSNIIQSQTSNYKSGSIIIDFPLNAITGNKKSAQRNELKYAIAYDSAEYSLTNGTPTLTIDCKYDRYIGVYDVGVLVFRFHWELLRYIQDKGMIHRCTVMYTQK